MKRLTGCRVAYECEHFEEDASNDDPFPEKGVKEVSPWNSLALWHRPPGGKLQWLTEWLTECVLSNEIIVIV